MKIRSGGPSPSDVELHDLRLDVRRPDVKASQRHRKGEPPGTDAPGVQVEDRAHLLDPASVGMPVDHDRHAGRRRIEIQVFGNVDDVEQTTGHLHRLPKRQSRQRSTVHVAPDGRDGGDLGQSLKDGRVPDVSGMDDVVAPPKEGKHLPSEEAVGVAHHPDERGLRARVQSPLSASR